MNILRICRSREGAWIEMLSTACSPKNANVAPVRERGLKYIINMPLRASEIGRSREGAWIEIVDVKKRRSEVIQSLP